MYGMCINKHKTHTHMYNKDMNKQKPRFSKGLLICLINH